MRIIDSTAGTQLPAIIIFAAMLIAGYWVFLVPVFQSPDEDYHADYIFSLYSRGRLIRGKEAPLAACSHPFVAYLLEATNGQAIKWFNFVKVPANYGTPEFFKAIDHNAPDKRTCAQTNTNPVLIAVYPIGYYALTAIWLSLLSHLNSNLSFLFFAARFLSVILLGCGLALSYLIMRELGFSYANSSLMLAAIAFFPMVSFVGSYIQPDNLSFVVVSACFFLALRWRNSKTGRCNRLLWALSLAMAVLLLTKYQFFCCVAIAIVAMVIAKAIRSKFSLSRLMAILALLLLPSVLAGIMQLWISWDCSLPVLDYKHWHWFPVDAQWHRVRGFGGQTLLTHICDALCYQYQSVYELDGTTFASFWGCFGQCLTVPLVIASIDINDALRFIIDIATKIILSLTLISLLKAANSLLGLIRSGRFRDVFYIACSNPVINSYFLFVLFMFLFNVIVHPSFSGQGRHWFPLILSIFLAAASFAPRVFPSRDFRRKIFLLVAGALLFYSLIGNYFAFGCIEKRYYGADNQPAIDIRQLQPTAIGASYSIDGLEYIDAYPTFKRHPRHSLYSMVVPAGKNICIRGWAIDFPAASPASAVLIFVDHGQMYRATYGLENDGAVKQLFDKKYRFSGFGALISTKNLSLGKHSLSLKTISRDGTLLYNADKDINIQIE